MTEPEQPQEQAQTRAGRPRPEATVAQDAQVLQLIEASVDENGQPAGITRKALEEQTGLPGNKVYLSIWRLKTAGSIHKVEGNKWAKVAA